MSYIDGEFKFSKTRDGKYSASLLIHGGDPYRQSATGPYYMHPDESAKYKSHKNIRDALKEVIDWLLVNENLFE